MSEPQVLLPQPDMSATILLGLGWYQGLETPIWSRPQKRHPSQQESLSKDWVIGGRAWWGGVGKWGET